MLNQLDLRTDSSRRPSRLRDLMSWKERAKYLAWRAGLLGQAAHTVNLDQGDRLVLRPPPATDLNGAMEIYVCGAYQAPRHIHVPDIKRIVDLGANIGLSVVYFAKRFPFAKIEAYEPHPEHVAAIRRHIRANGLDDRVELHQVAVGCTAGEIFLTDQQMESKVVTEPGAATLPVSLIDWIEQERGRRIDLLKIDIEGSEYELLLDPRFAEIHAQHIVLEWHAGRARPQGDIELRERLEQLGYQVENASSGQLRDLRFGMLWAFRAS